MLRSNAKGDVLLGKYPARVTSGDVSWLIALLAVGHLLLYGEKQGMGGDAGEHKSLPFAGGFKSLVFVTQTRCLPIPNAC